MKVPAVVGVPLMVMVLLDQAAVNPEGKPAAVPIPVALVVVCVILLNEVLIHKLGVLEAALAVIAGVTVIVPVAFTLPHPPANGIE